MASDAENIQSRNQEEPSARPKQPTFCRIQTPPSGGNNHPPSAMNYPQQPYPPQGYAGYGYNPYPPAAYAQDPAVAYYGTHQYAQANEGGNACFRCICLILLLSFMLTIITSIMFFFVPEPDHINFKVDSFSVSNFNVNQANKVVTGNWDAKVAVDSGRSRLRINKLESNLYQKDTWLAAGSNLQLTTGYWDDVSWSVANTMMEFRYDLNNATAPADEMQKEIKEAGGVTFNLRMNLNYAQRMSGFWWHVKIGVMNVTCKDLKIGLAVGTNTGTLSGDKKNCEASG